MAKACALLIDMRRELDTYKWQALSIVAYSGSVWYHDRLFRQHHIMANVVGVQTLISTALLCFQGSSCLGKGIRTNTYIFALSLFGVFSIIMTNRGQIASGLATRLFLKSTKIVPILFLDGLSTEQCLFMANLTGCLALCMGCFTYLYSTVTFRLDPEETLLSGGTLLLTGALIDSFLAMMS